MNIQAREQYMETLRETYLELKKHGIIENWIANIMRFT
jgi:hypothetical protein